MTTVTGWEAGRIRPSLDALARPVLPEAPTRGASVSDPYHPCAAPGCGYLVRWPWRWCPQHRPH